SVSSVGWSGNPFGRIHLKGNLELKKRSSSQMDDPLRIPWRQCPCVSVSLKLRLNYALNGADVHSLEIDFGGIEAQNHDSRLSDYCDRETKDNRLKVVCYARMSAVLS
ncbi:hypothetical protein AVEN_63761-1, partial [Araneus ventricosus]